MFKTGTATDYSDLLDQLDDYLTAKGSAFGLTYAGTGDGTFTAYGGGASSVAETFTITATSATNFTVVGTLAGSIGPATVGTPFVHAKIEFTLTAGVTPFVSGDVFELATAPKWTSKRRALGCRILATAGNTGANAAQNLVDGKNAVDTRYFRVNSAPEPFDIEFDFFETETIADYELAVFSATYPSSMPEAWTFDYWTGSAWATLDTVSGQTGWTESEVRSFNVGAPVSATKYRLHITTLGSATLQIGAVRLRRSDGVDAAFAATIWEAPGNDGNSEILVGVHPFERQDADYFNWELAGFDGYLASSAWYQQAGHHGKCYLPLWDASIPYWFVVDGRRVVVVAKLNTQYEVAYLGFVDPYFTPDQWPYPLAIGGALAFGPSIPAWNDIAWRWSNISNNHRALTHSDPGTQTYTEPEYRQFRARQWAGSWLGYMGTSGDDIPYANEDAHFIWPAACGLMLLDPNLDGGYTRWPAMLNAATPNTIGEISGIAVVSGQDLTAETLINDGAIEWIAFHNIYRTDRDDFLAVALD
jgi:hypothetical protein